MNIQIKKILIEVIKSSYPKSGRPSSKEIEHYLDVILYVLNSDIKWKYLKEHFHHDTYRKKFQYWCQKLNIFEKSHQVICSLLQKSYFNHSNLKQLFMDSSDILNKLGVECIGRSRKYKFKNATKINIITNKDGIILAIKIYPANVSDTIITKDTLDNIHVKLLSSRKYRKYIVTDKGYVNINEKNKIKNKAVLMYPDKSNTVNCPYNKYQKRLRKVYMKKRYINENAFSWLKNSKRTTMRCDRLLTTFKGFVYLQALKNLSSKIKLLNISF